MMLNEKQKNILCLGGISLSISISIISSFLVAYLLDHPLVHLLVNGSIPALIIGGAQAKEGNMPLIIAGIAGLIGLSLFDVFYWWAGKRFEHRLREDLKLVLKVKEKKIIQAEALAKKYGVKTLILIYFLPIPNAPLMLLLGASKVKLWKFMLADLSGAVLFESIMLYLGWQLNKKALHAAHLINHYALIITLLSVIGIIALNWKQIKANTTQTK